MARAHLPPLPRRLLELRGPEIGGRTMRAAERELEALAPEHAPPHFDLTYADTRRFPPADWVLPSFAKAASGGGMTYTPYRGDREVRRKVATHLATFLGGAVDPDSELILTPGTQAGLFSALSSLVEAGDTVAMFDPDYMTTERTLRYLGASVQHIPIQWEDGAGKVDLAALERIAREGTKLLVFSHPNNPTGAVFEPATVEGIAAIACRYNLTVLVDELYCRLVFDQRPFTHLATIDGMRDRCITLLGPSKTESMSGYRVGIAVAPPDIVDRMEDVLSVAALRAPAYAQHTLTRWLVDDVSYVTARLADYQRLRDRATSMLAESKYLEPYNPNGTAYMFPAVRGLSASNQAIALEIRRMGVTINPGYQFGPGGSHHFRICFAQEDEALAEAIDRIIQAIQRLA
ncbi:MAG: aminotransferase class I/II-fold pyridoxal phosphate-dependent enzyme [Candidatus Dormibacteraeota bacterium]|nr:aminotransferase class I/II-fold pyridoxal phosphate-dependent enzyme [Candidatus Dormibacteraeota bacterium]